MNKVLKIYLSIFLVIIGIIWVLKYFYLDHYPTPNPRLFYPDINEIRSLVEQDSGSLPQKIGTIIVGEGYFPELAVEAGGSYSKHLPCAFASFLIHYDNSYILMDAVHDSIFHSDFEFSTTYYYDKFVHMQQKMKNASLIFVTHEHWDHVQGIACSPFFDQIAPNVCLTSEQLQSEALLESKFEGKQIAALKPLKYEGLYRISPGVVLVKSPGHTLGSQMVYVKQSNGEEFLFTGDVVWNSICIQDNKGHNKLVSKLGGENRPQQVAQIDWLHNLSLSENIHIVVNHDKNQISSLIEGSYIMVE